MAVEDALDENGYINPKVWREFLLLLMVVAAPSYIQF
jgi:hypothetical protein